MASRYEVELLSTDDDARWDRFVRTTPEHTLFSTSRWRNILARALGKEWRVYGCLKNGNLVAGCAALRVRRLGIDLFLPPPLTGYPGFHLSRPEGKRRCVETDETLRRVSALEEAIRRSTGYARLVHHPGFVDLRPFAWNGWETVPRYTFRMKPLPPEELVTSFRHNLRKAIRKAEEGGVVVRRVDRIEEVAELWSSSYGRHGEPPPITSGRLASWYGRLYEEGIARGYVAEGADGKAHAFRVILVGKGGAFDWVAGSDPAFLSAGGTPYLLKKILEELGLEGIESFDMMGANTPTIASFKAGFGGELVPYGETRRARSAFIGRLLDWKARVQSFLPR